MHPTKSPNEEFKSILIIGIKGSLAQTTAKLLIKKFPQAKIIGVDSRELGDFPSIPHLTALTIKYTRGSFENLFRNHSFDLVYHIGRILHPDAISQLKFTKKIDLGLMETRRALDLCLNFNVKKMVILSTFHVYGAHPDNPVFIKEEFPLRASVIYPALLNVIEVDQIASTWLWKNQDKVSTVMLRPCNIIGPQVDNTICRYLTNWYSPRPIDYNPMFQFIHENDVAKALTFSSTSIPTGVYNLAPDDFVSIREALEITENSGIPMPMFLLDKMAMLARKLGKGLPDYLIDYLKFSCLIDSSKIKQHLPPGFFQYNTREALRLMSTLS